MTTNSPNPVDGDVQALIADCQQEIKHLEGRIAYCNKYGVGLSDYESQLKRQQVALAALTAEPVYQFIVNNPDKDGYIEWADCNPDYFSNEPSDSRRILYTAPPAQLLRPVELPHAYSPALSSVLKNATDGVAVMRCDKNGRWINKTAVIEALRQQGYEVKP